MHVPTGWSRALLVVLSTASAIPVAEAMTRFIASGPMLSHGVLSETSTRTVDGVALWDIKVPRYSNEDLQRASAAANAFTIVGLGDSIMYGVGQAKEVTYLEQTRQALASRSSRPVQVLNLAVPGYNTMQENAVYKEISDRIRADLVIVHYWGDDARQYRVIGGYVADFGDITPEGRVVQALPLPPRVSDYLLLHSRLYDVLTNVLVTRSRNMPPDDWMNVSKPLAAIQERVQHAGGRMLVLASPLLGGEAPLPNPDLPRLEQFASTRGIDVVDLTQWLDGVDAPRIALDGCHFNAEGHRILGARLAAYLLEHDLKH